MKVQDLSTDDCRGLLKQLNRMNTNPDTSLTALSVMNFGRPANV